MKRLIPFALLSLSGCLFLEAPGQNDPTMDMTGMMDMAPDTPDVTTPDLPVDPTTCDPTCPPDKTCALEDGQPQCVCDPTVYRPSVPGLPCQVSCTGPMAPDCDGGKVCDDTAEATGCACPEGLEEVDGVCKKTCQSKDIVSCDENQECDDSKDTPICVCSDGYQDHDNDGECQPTCENFTRTCPGERVCRDDSGVALCECPLGFQDESGDGVCEKGCDHPDFVDCVAPEGCWVFKGDPAMCVHAPKNCAEAASLMMAEEPFPAMLYPDNDASLDPIPVLCHRPDDSAPFRAYLDLISGDNYAIDLATNKKTTYERVRLDPETLTIDITDSTFAMTEPNDNAATIIPSMFQPPSSETFEHVPYATARGCTIPPRLMMMGPGTVRDVVSKATLPPTFPLRFMPTDLYGASGAHCQNPTDTGGQRTLTQVGRSMTLATQGNAREPGCLIYGPQEFVAHFTRRCMGNITAGRPIPGDNFVLQLEYMPRN